MARSILWVPEMSNAMEPLSCDPHQGHVGEVIHVILGDQFERKGAKSACAVNKGDDDAFCSFTRNFRCNLRIDLTGRHRSLTGKKLMMPWAAKLPSLQATHIATVFRARIST